MLVTVQIMPLRDCLSPLAFIMLLCNASACQIRPIFFGALRSS